MGSLISVTYDKDPRVFHLLLCHVSPVSAKLGSDTAYLQGIWLRGQGGARIDYQRNKVAINPAPFFALQHVTWAVPTLDPVHHWL